jgi:hypothetical protein
MNCLLAVVRLREPTADRLPMVAVLRANEAAHGAAPHWLGALHQE